MTNVKIFGGVRDLPKFYKDGKHPGKRISRMAAALRMQVSAVKGSRKLPFIVKRILRYFRPRITRMELGLFCRQLGVMLDAGMPLLPALGILHDQAEKVKLKQALEGIIGSLEGGSSFGAALIEYPEVFPGIFATMVTAGETGGILVTVLKNLAVFFEWEHKIREQIKSSVTYPLVVLVIAILAVNFVVVFVLPVFTGILEQMNAELPFLTKLILALSAALRSCWYIFLPAFLGIVLGIFRIKNTSRGRKFFDAFFLKVPVIGGLLQKIIVSRFCRTLSSLLRVGVPLTTALEVVERTSGNVVVEENIARAREAIFEGEGMAEPLRQSRVFPLLVIEMIAVGEETGALDLMLEKVGDFYDTEVETLATRLASLVEPALILFVGGIVALILLSVFLPLFDVLGRIE